jgi:hypothetical protein
MSRFLSAIILVLSCNAASAASLCPFDTPACRMMPDRYIAPQMAPDGSYYGSGNQPTYSNPPTFRYRQMLPNGGYGRSPKMDPDGGYGDEE